MHFIRIKSISHPQWDEAWEIYKNSFPIFEQRTENDQIEVMKDDMFECRVYVKDNDVIGILFFWQYDIYRYIEHFAINPRLRGQNYGSEILNEFCKSDYTTFLEIDLPIDEVSINRLYFYERLGFKLNQFDHVHPPYRKGFDGHSLKILSFKKYLDNVEFETFNLFLAERVMKYSEHA